MSGGGDGLASAVGLAMAEAGPMVPPVEEQVFLPLGDAVAIEAERDTINGRNPHVAVERVRAAGRPKGAMNKRTGFMRDYLLTKYTHPGEALAQTYSRPVEALAAELGCTKLEAFQVQVRAAGELLPYIESKMPIGVHVDARGVIQLVMHGADPNTGAITDVDGSEFRGLSSMLFDDEQKQGVEP